MMPEGTTRTRGYEESGWTFYERCSAEQIKKFDMIDATWKLVLDLGKSEYEQQLRDNLQRLGFGSKQLDRLLNGTPVTIKSGLSQAMAERYQKRLADAGLITQVLPDGATLVAPPAPPAPPAAVAAASPTKAASWRWTWPTSSASTIIIPWHLTGIERQSR